METRMTRVLRIKQIYYKKMMDGYADDAGFADKADLF
mgnify:CR=1 FL=1